MAHSAKIAMTGPRESPKVVKSSAVRGDDGAKIQHRKSKSAENHMGSSVKPCWLLIEKRELANKHIKLALNSCLEHSS